MTYTNYRYEDFDKDAAAQGSLVLMIKNDYEPPIGVPYNSIANMVVNYNEGTETYTSYPNNKLKGAGVCMVRSNNFILTVDNESYTFKIDGNPISPNAFGWTLYMGFILQTPQDIGNAIDTRYQQSTTRSNAGITTAITGQNQTVMVDVINARDTFAMQALQGIMEHIERPDCVSDSEMDFYTKMAYKWAANMMMAAANSRSELVDGEGGEPESHTETESVNVGALEGNTERLLNNIVAALEKTDEKQIIGDEGSQTTIYSERVSVPKLIEWLTAYSHHTPTSEEDTQTTVGLDDLINAIKEIGSGGGGGSTTVDFTDLITALNTTQTIGIRGTLPDINIGNTGLGRDNSHPLYISGGGFPNRQSLAAALPAESIHDLLTFNADGAVAYSTKDETKKAMLGYLNDYATLTALSTAVLGELTADAVYNKIQNQIDTRIRAWLEAARDAEGRSLTVNTPQ